MGFLNDLGAALSGATAKVSSKAAEMADITKLMTQSATEKAKLKGLYQKVGELYIEKFELCPDEALAEVVAEVTASKEKIAELEVAISAAKKEKVCPACGATNDTAAAFCKSCGAALPVVEAPVEEVVEEAATEEAPVEE